MPYKRVDLPSDEPVQFVGVHTLKWSRSPMKPTAGFVEIDKDAQSTRIEALEAALEPFAEAYDKWRNHEGWNDLVGVGRGEVGLAVELGDLRAARAALRGQGAEGAVSTDGEGE